MLNLPFEMKILFSSPNISQFHEKMLLLILNTFISTLLKEWPIGTISFSYFCNFFPIYFIVIYKTSLTLIGSSSIFGVFTITSKEVGRK